MYPILFSVGPVHIYSFGVFLALAFLIGTFVTWRYGRDEIYEETILDFILVSIVSTLFSGRLIFILTNPATFEGNILRMIHIFNFPGFSFVWGLIIGLISGILFCFKKKVDPGFVLDVAVLGLALGIAIGETGCFLNGCIVGIKTNLPWGIYMLGSLEKQHPLSLYGTLITILIFLILRKIYNAEKDLRKFISKKEKEEGTQGKVATVFFLLFGTSHFLLEFLRVGSVYLLGLKLNQIAYLFMVIPAMMFLAKSLSISKFKDLILKK